MGQEIFQALCMHSLISSFTSPVTLALLFQPHYTWEGMGAQRVEVVYLVTEVVLEHTLGL